MGALGTLTKIAGGVVGAVAGGPAGAMTGMAIGDKVGGVAEGVTQKKAPPAVSTDSALMRRYEANSSSRLQQLRDSITALPELPEDLRKEYAAPLLMAYRAESKGGQG